MSYKPTTVSTRSRKSARGRSVTPSREKEVIDVLMAHLDWNAGTSAWSGLSTPQQSILSTSQSQDPTLIGGLRMPSGSPSLSLASGRKRGSVKGRRIAVSPTGPGSLNLLSDSSLQQLVPDGTFSLFGNTTSRGDIFSSTGGLSLTDATIPDNVNLEKYNKVYTMKAGDNGLPATFAGTDLYAGSKDSKADETLYSWDELKKNKLIVAFDNNPNNSTSMALSPALCVRGDPTSQTIGGIYLTVYHFVEAMRVNTAKPAQIDLFGVQSQQEQDTCALTKQSLSQILSNPHHQIVRSMTSSCNQAAKANGFYNTDGATGRYYVSLFLGLWNKILSHPMYRQILFNTGNKFLVYNVDVTECSDDSDTIALDNKKAQGANVVGLMLMVIRATIRKFPQYVNNVKDCNPAALYTKVVLPMLTKLIPSSTS